MARQETKTKTVQVTYRGDFVAKHAETVKVDGEKKTVYRTKTSTSGKISGYEVTAGKPFEVPADEPMLAKWRNNSHFKVA